MDGALVGCALVDGVLVVSVLVDGALVQLGQVSHADRLDNDLELGMDFNVPRASSHL